MLVTPQKPTSPLERLPPEIRLKIYQAYLDSPIVEYEDCLDYDRRFCGYEGLMSASLLRDWKSDANEGSGFWSPFGVSITMCRSSKNDPDPVPWPGVLRWRCTALWHVGGPIGGEARDYMFNERMKFSLVDGLRFTETTHEFYEFYERVREREAKTLRKAFFDVTYFAQSERYDSLHHRHYPLFKIEIQDKCRTLRVLSLHELVPTEVSRCKTAVDFYFEIIYPGRKQDFDGDDIMAAICQLFEAAMALWRGVDLDDRERFACWGDDSTIFQVSSDVEPLPMKGCNVPKNQRVERPSTYRHVVTEVKLESA